MKKALVIVAIISIVFLFGAVGDIDRGANDAFTWFRFWGSGLLFAVDFLALYVVERKESEGKQ